LNFKIFGTGLIVLGGIVAVLGYPQAFPPEPEYTGRITQGMIDSAKCFFEKIRCDSPSLTSSVTEPNFLLFFSGLALLAVGLLVVISARREK
jgi:hypothetical protein